MTQQQQAAQHRYETDLRSSSCQNKTVSRLHIWFWRTAGHQPQHPSGERLSVLAVYTEDPKDKSLIVVYLSLTVLTSLYIQQVVLGTSTSHLLPCSTVNATRGQTLLPHHMFNSPAKPWSREPALTDYTERTLPIWHNVNMGCANEFF